MTGIYDKIMKNKIFKSTYFLPFLFAVTFHFYSCSNDDFSPLGEYKPKIVAYGVLENTSNIQYVRIQKTYQPGRNNMPDDKNIQENMSISVVDPYALEYRLTPASVQGSNNFDYYLFPVSKLYRGQKYSLIIKSESFPIQVTTATVPPVQNIYLTRRFGDYVFAFLGFSGSGYVFHFEVEYELKGIKSKMEVPYNIIYNDNDTIFVYPQIRESFLNTEFVQYEISDWGWQAKYKFVYLAQVMSQISQKSKIYGEIKITNAYISISSLDWNLFNYAMAIKGFNDPYSIRLDDIFWTNIKDGAGVFGSVVTDTVNIKLPKDLIENLGMTDAQK